MVKLEFTKTKKSDDEIRHGAYYRCFGDLEMARILSTVQSLIIRYGHELEQLVEELMSDHVIEDIDDFLSVQIMHHGVRIVFKPEIRRSKLLEGHGIEPDFIIFKRSGRSQECYIVELKDGHEFDTKSSAREHQNLHTFLSKNALALQYFNSFCKICGFNAESRDEIVRGFKNKIAKDQAMTGRQLFDLLELDYDEALRRRAADREANLEYLVKSLLDTNAVRQRLG